MRLIGILAWVTMIAGCATPRLAPETALTARAPHPLQDAYDVLAYDLSIEFKPRRKSISGRMEMTALALAPIKEAVLDLDARFKVRSVRIDGAEASHRRGDGRLFATADIDAGTRFTVAVDYKGKPHEARNAPWDGGLVWSKTEDGAPWIGTAVQGEGCDLWWPCKDQFLDKPDAMEITLTVPRGLFAASNGVLEEVEKAKKTTTYRWRTDYPISPYNVAVGIGPYTELEDVHRSEAGVETPIQVWVLPENREKALRLIDDLKRQLHYFEERLGPYPWPDEKVGIVETPFFGMEHQTINAYGAGFPVHPHGFDWLLQHELSHEWFGNAMTHADDSDFWLHEGFATYMQADYAARIVGDQAFDHYLYNYRLQLKNCEPIVPIKDDRSGFDIGNDVYYKGALTLHTLRWLIGEEAFWEAVRELIGNDPGRVYRSTGDFVEIASDQAGEDLSWFFNAFLSTRTPPELLIARGEEAVRLTWRLSSGAPFPLPVAIEIDGVRKVIAMSNGEALVPVPSSADLRIDPDGDLLRSLPITAACP
ncbi:MAG: M1 family metallopeptidase [Pseudomonadota bacterium]